MITIAVEVPFAISTCIQTDYTNLDNDIGFKLHLFNQGLLKLFVLYSYLESFFNFLFYGEFFTASYFGTTGIFNLIEYILIISSAY